MQKESNNDSRLRSLAVVFSAIMLMMVVVLGSGALSFTVAAAPPDDSYDVDFVPTYRDVTYTMDNVETLQRWDSAGNWNLDNTPTIDDSTLQLQNAEGANITVDDWSHIDDGYWYEARVKANSTSADFVMDFDQFGSTDKIQIGLNTSADIVVTWDNSSGEQTVDLGDYTADTWYRVAVLFDGSSDDDPMVYAYQDNYTVISSQELQEASLLHSEIDAIKFSNSAADTVATVDYFYQTDARTEFTSASTSDDDVNPAPSEEEKYAQTEVDFSDRDQKPGTYSNYSEVHDAYGYTPTDKSLTNDRYMNKTDFGEVLTQTKETDNPVTGMAKFVGWQDLQGDNEQHLKEYLCDVHNKGVDQIHVIDYYLNDAKLNYTWDSDMQEEVDDAWLDIISDESDNLGADLQWDDNADDGWFDFSVQGTATAPLAIGSEASDVDYVYFPNDVTQKSFSDSMEKVSDYLRAKVLGLNAIVPEDFSNCTNRADLSLSVQEAATMGIFTNALANLDSAYQFTDAALGQMLQDAEYMLIDLTSVQQDLSWSVMDDGKPAQAPLSMVSILGSNVVTIMVVGIVAVIAAVSLFFVFKKKKQGQRRR